VNAWRVNPEWVERYEQLRAHATGQAPLGFIPLGLALLQHRGVAGWMTAAGSSDDFGSRVRAGRARDRESRNEGDARRSELVRLLAGAALRVATGRAR
jgi:hypothetical protein